MYRLSETPDSRYCPIPVDLWSGQPWVAACFHGTAIATLPALNLSVLPLVLLMAALVLSGLFQIRTALLNKRVRLIIEGGRTRLIFPGREPESVNCQFDFVSPVLVTCRIKGENNPLPRFYAVPWWVVAPEHWRRLHILLRDERR